MDFSVRFLKDLFDRPLQSKCNLHCRNIWYWLRHPILSLWEMEDERRLTSVCTIAGRWVRSVFTVWKRSTTPSYLILSSTMLRVMKTPVLPTPALRNTHTDTHTKFNSGYSQQKSTTRTQFSALLQHDMKYNTYFCSHRPAYNNIQQHYKQPHELPSS